jgi:hypothetical protein
MLGNMQTVEIEDIAEYLVACADERESATARPRAADYLILAEKIGRLPNGEERAVFARAWEEAVLATRDRIQRAPSLLDRVRALVAPFERNGVECSWDTAGAPAVRVYIYLSAGAIAARVSRVLSEAGYRVHNVSPWVELYVYDRPNAPEAEDE